MRLLRIQDGELSLKKFDKQIPSYAILSHTWGAAEDEVTFEDVSRNEARNKRGYEKINFCAEQAAVHNLEFFWVDTCCINKADVQEFQNAINSMYRWYRNAEVCFVYMADVITESTNPVKQESIWKRGFRQSRWFTRSWTLQELLSPQVIEFYSRSHELLGNKESLEQELHVITKIPVSTLRGVDSSPFSVEKCILWGKDRESTYEEDQAYSLLGLCGVSMAPNYGEGAQGAFARLRKRCNKQLNKEKTAPVQGAGGGNDWNHASRSYEVPWRMRVDEDFPIAQTRTNDFPETKRGPLNGTLRRLIDLFDTSLTALKNFQDAVGHSLYNSVDSEVGKLQRCRRSLLQSASQNKTKDDPNLYSSVGSLLNSIDEVSRNTKSNFLNSNLENQKSFKAQGLSSRITQSESKSTRFREQIDHATQLELLTKLVRVLCSLLISDWAEGARVGRGEITALDDVDYLKSKDLSRPLTASADLMCNQALRSLMNSGCQSFRRFEPKKSRKEKVSFCKSLAELPLTSAADARKQVSSWLLHDYVPNEVYDRFAPERLEGTCNWILEREFFRSWCSDSFPGRTAKIMWVHGPAGFGKTVLCTRIISHLTSEIQTPIAHFFFSTDSEREDPYVAIRSWTWQTMAHSQALDLAYDAREADCVSGATRAKLVDLFQSIVHSIPGCTFILDGLDECCWEDKMRHKRNSVGEFLGSLKQAVANTNTRILITSRNEPEIQQGLGLENEGVYDYGISIDDNRSDTGKYSRSIIEKNLPKKKIAMKQQLAMMLADHCGGQFLWIRMQENSLDSLMTEGQLRKAIETTPAQLDQVYDPNWRKIMSLPSVQLNRAVTILRWVAFAFRPLTIGEIVEAQAITDDCEDLPVDDIQEVLSEGDIEKQILKDCGSLLEVRSNPSRSFKVHTVHLTHFTVKQYLISHMPLPIGHLSALEVPSQQNENEHSVEIGKICLQYINFSTAWQQPKQAEPGISQHALLGYAAESWYRHTAAKQPMDSRITDVINVFFDANKANWVSWRTWFDSIGWDLVPQRESGSERCLPVYYAALLGFKATVKHLLQGMDQKRDQTSMGFALRATCESGNLGILKVLLEAGGSMTMVDAAGNSPLNIASAKGHTAVVKVLLDRDADVSAASKDGVTALHNASSNGHTDIVKLLLDKDADVSAASKDGWTLLHGASLNGHTDIVKLLFDKDADVTV